MWAASSPHADADIYTTLLHLSAIYCCSIYNGRRKMSELIPVFNRELRYKCTHVKMLVTVYSHGNGRLQCHVKALVATNRYILTW